MRRIVSSLLAAAAATNLMWFNVIPNASTYCGPTAVSFVTSGQNGDTIPWVNSAGQLQLCALVAKFPSH